MLTPVSADTAASGAEKKRHTHWKLVVMLVGIIVILGVAAASGANGTTVSDQHSHLKQEITAGSIEENNLVKTDATHFSYSGLYGPSNWKYGVATCGGSKQSPINIATRAVHGRGDDAAFFYQRGRWTLMAHNPHTVDVSFYAKPDYVVVRGTRYDLAQFHFHHPSEHTINGRHADAEVHFVHLNKKLGKYVVLALMCYVPRGYERENELLDEVITESGNFPSRDGQKTWTNLRGMNVLGKLGIWKRYGQVAFEYEGSLTTPPCTESVTWLIRKKKAFISRQTLRILKKSFGVNNRPVQGLNGRVVRYGKLKRGRRGYGY